MGTQPLPEIHAAQYDNALLRQRFHGTGENARRDIIAYALLGDFAGDFGVGDLLVRHGDVFPADVVLVISVRHALLPYVAGRQ